MTDKCLLALETTTDVCSAALWHHGTLHTLAEVAPREHAKRLLPMVDALLSNAGIAIADVHGIAVTQGPGTFTGVRTGMSIAQGLALPHQIPLYAISSLLVMAEGARRALEQTQVLTMMDARMNEVYYAGWQWSADAGWQCAISECVCPPEKITLPASLNGWQGVGIGWEVYQGRFPDIITPASLPITAQHFPQAQDLITLVLSNCRHVTCTDALHIEPSYLRNDVADKQ